MNVLADLSPVASVEDLDPSSMWPVGLVFLTLILVGLWIDVGWLATSGRNSSRWRNRLRRLVRRPVQLHDAAIVILPGVTLVLAMVAAHFLIPLNGDEVQEADILTPGMVLQNLGIEFLGIGLIGLALFKRKLSWKNAFGHGIREWGAMVKWGLIFYLGAIPAVSLAGLINHQLLQFLGVEVTPQDVIMMMGVEQSGLTILLTGILAVVVAPVFEELLFRGLLLPIAIRRLGPWPGLLVMSALFAGVHFHLPSFLPLMTIALAFSVAYIQTGTILVPMVMHLLFNGVNLSMLFVVRYLS